MRDRIVYVALAEARGHLMRAHLLRERLGSHGIAVEVVTTSSAGQRFLAALGTPAVVLPGGASLVFDGAHNLRRRATTTALLRYLARPSGMRADRAWLVARAHDAAFVVSDSLHPALLFAPPSLRVVQVYGENILGATQTELAGLGPLAPLGARVLARAIDRALARVEHRLGDEPTDDRVIRLPPILPTPILPTPRGLAGDERPVAYLNPHFEDGRIAAAIEAALGPDLYGVAEGFAARPGWRAVDPHLVDHVARAAVFVTGAGMGGIGMARAFAVPTIVLLSDQPEQRANAEQIRGLPHVRIVELGDDLHARLAAATTSLRAEPIARPDPIAVARANAARWTETFLQLVDRARANPEPRTPHDEHPAIALHRPRPRDQQPRRRSGRSPRAHLAAPGARLVARADP
jgi:hypothetical protein